MMIAGTGGSHRDGTRLYPHFSLHTRRTLEGHQLSTLRGMTATLATAKAVIRTETP